MWLLQDQPKYDERGLTCSAYVEKEELVPSFDWKVKEIEYSGDFWFKRVAWKWILINMSWEVFFILYNNQPMHN